MDCIFTDRVKSLTDDIVAKIRASLYKRDYLAEGLARLAIDLNNVESAKRDDQKTHALFVAINNLSNHPHGMASVWWEQMCRVYNTL